MINNIEATILGMAAQVPGETTLTGPMCQIAQSLEEKGFVTVTKSDYPASAVIVATDAGREIAKPVN